MIDLLLVLRKREKLGMMHDYYHFSGTITKLSVLPFLLFLCCLESLTVSSGTTSYLTLRFYFCLLLLVFH